MSFGYGEFGQDPCLGVPLWGTKQPCMGPVQGKVLQQLRQVKKAGRTYRRPTSGRSMAPFMVVVPSNRMLRTCHENYEGTVTQVELLRGRDMTQFDLSR